MIRIVTDSSSDITQAEAKQLGITVMPLTINFGSEGLADGIDIMPTEFYDRLVNGGIHPTTSQASPLAYEEIFTDAKNAGDTVILLPLSKEISGSHNCAEMVKRQGNFDNVFIVDTQCTVSKLRMLVYEALCLKDAMAPQQLVDYLEEFVTRVHLYAMVDTLEYLLKGGRVSKASAVIGGMLSVKPIITIDGVVKVIGKAIGVKKGISAVAEYYKNIDVDDGYPIMFGYAGQSDRCVELINKCIESDVERRKYIAEARNISPIVGVHTGPNLAVMVFVEKKK